MPDRSYECEHRMGFVASGFEIQIGAVTASMEWALWHQSSKSMPDRSCECEHRMGFVASGFEIQIGAVTASMEWGIVTRGMPLIGC